MDRESSRHETVNLQTNRFLIDDKPTKRLVSTYLSLSGIQANFSIFSGFDVIYDVIPSMSKYQASVVLMALYIRFAAGAIQFAQNILQGDPQSKTCVSFGDHPIENHIKSGGSDLDQIRIMGADYVSSTNHSNLDCPTPTVCSC